MTSDNSLARYARQIRFAPLGEAGQKKLLASRVLICGVGALGTVLANTLARAGVGFIRLVDRDFVETTNLQRQVLFDEQDVLEQLPKAEAAARKLRRINSQIEIEPNILDLHAGNILAVCDGIDLILDGTDNFETRFLLNDAACQLGIPWVYGGCLGAEGQCLVIQPGKTPCLRCVIPEPPPSGSMPTCDTAGILASIIQVVASIQATEAIKLLTGAQAAVLPFWNIIDLWHNQFRQIRLDELTQTGGCPTCRKEEFPWLAGRRASQSAVLCGRNAVQVSPPAGGQMQLSLEEMAAKLAPVADIVRNAYLLRAQVPGYLITVFPDGRAIISGTEDIGVAKGVYAQYIGS